MGSKGRALLTPKGGGIGGPAVSIGAAGCAPIGCAKGNVRQARALVKGDQNTYNRQILS
jgi:hypothetical protein